MGCRAAFRSSRSAGYRSQGRAMRRSAERRAQAASMQALWQGVHSRTSDWCTHGFIRGIMRSVLQLRTPQNGDGEQHNVGGIDVGANSGVNSPEAAAPPEVRFREPQIEMAHGAGGKASRRLIEGLFAPLLFGASPGPLGDAAHIQINGTRI